MLDIWRKGAVKQITVTLGELPSERKQGRPVQRMKADEPAAPNKYGLVLADLTADQHKEISEVRGVGVEDAQGAAAKAGIQKGDVILSVNNTDVKSINDFNQVVGKLDPKRNIALLVKRGERTLYVAIKAADK